MAASSPDPIALTKTFVSIPSSFPHEHAMVDTVESALNAGGFAVRRQDIGDGRCNLLAEKGVPGKPALLFIGHMDTVPPPVSYDAAGLDPFTLRHDAPARVYRGLGVADMKGGLAAVVAAVSRFKPENSLLKVAFCVDEENISQGAHSVVKQERAWLSDVKLIISADTGAVPFAVRRRFPPVLCIMGRLGRFTINATVHGSGGHGAHADPSLSAPMEMARLLMLIDQSRDALFTRHERLGRSDMSIAGLKSTADGFTSPEVAKAQFNWMALPEDTPDAALGKLSSLIRHAYQTGRLRNTDRPVELEVPRRATPYGNGYATPHYGPMLDLVVGAYADIIGEAPRYVIARSVGDENVYAEALPEVPLINLGPVGGDLHTANEWADEQAIPTAAALYHEVATVFDALGVYKPFYDALSAPERRFVDLATWPGCTWDRINKTLAGSNFNPRRVAEKVKVVLDQFFPPRRGEAPSLDATNETVTIRPDLAEAFRRGIDYLANRPVDALPIESGEMVVPPEAEAATATTGWRPVPDASPVDGEPEATALDAEPLAIWDVSTHGGKMASSRHRAVSRAPRPPADGSGSETRIIPPDPEDESRNDATASESSDSRANSTTRRAPRLPESD